MDDFTTNMTIKDAWNKTIEFRKNQESKIKKMKLLGVPKLVIEHEEFLAKMTYNEYQMYLKESDREIKQINTQYRKNNPPNQEVAKLIWEKFDKWFEKYKNNLEVLEEELGTGHYFYEAWFNGTWSINEEPEFFEKILSQDDFISENYLPVFEVCKHRIREQINLIKDNKNA